MWYICHETMSDRPVREVSVRVAKDLAELMDGLAGDGFPFDYFEAKGRERPSGK